MRLKPPQLCIRVPCVFATMPDPPMAAVAVARVAEEDAAVDVGPGAAIAAQPCPPDTLQRGKSSPEYRKWYKRQCWCKRRAAARRGDESALAAVQKQYGLTAEWKRKRRAAARRGDESALATLRENARKSAERRRKLAASARRKFATLLGVETREAGKDGKSNRFRGMVALKEACKAALSQ